jgi:hypothetical protein
MSPTQPRPKKLDHISIELQTPCGHMYAHFPFATIDNKLVPQEIFLTHRSGSCMHCMISATTRLASRFLRQSAASDPDVPRQIVKDLKGHSCPHASPFKPSCIHQLACAFESCLSLYEKGPFTQDDVDNLTVTF